MLRGSSKLAPLARTFWLSSFSGTRSVLRLVVHLAVSHHCLLNRTLIKRSVLSISGITSMYLQSELSDNCRIGFVAQQTNYCAVRVGIVFCRFVRRC